MIGDVVGDFFFVCPCNYFAMQYAEHGNKVFYYYFNHVLSPLYLLVRCHLTIVPHSSGRAPTRGATGWGCCTGTRSTTCSATRSTPAGPTPTPTHNEATTNIFCPNTGATRRTRLSCRVGSSDTTPTSPGTGRAVRCCGAVSCAVVVVVARTPVYNSSDNWPLYNRNEPQYYIWNGNIKGGWKTP